MFTRVIVIFPALVIALVGAANAEAPGNSAQPLLDAFIQVVDGAKGAAAVDWVYAHSPGLTDRDKTAPDVIAGKKRSLQKYLESAGPLHGHEVASTQSVGSRLVRVEYVLIADRSPLQVNLTLYRAPDNQWTVVGWSYGTNIDRLFNDAHSRQ